MRPTRHRINRVLKHPVDGGAWPGLGSWASSRGGLPGQPPPDPPQALQVSLVPPGVPPLAGGRRKVLAVGELLIKLLASGQVRSGELVCAREARGSKILY